jgi:hypothetical protein
MIMINNTESNRSNPDCLTFDRQLVVANSGKYYEIQQIVQYKIEGI